MPSSKPILTGYLDKSGHPTVKVSIFGVHPDLKQEFEAMIDTGFTGFLMMPIMSAFPLGLMLFGTSTYTLADGSSSAKLLGFGTVVIDGEETNGVIVLESNQTGLLLGMDFLRKAKRCLAVSVNGVALLDEDAVSAAMKAIHDLKKKQDEAIAAAAAKSQSPGEVGQDKSKSTEVSDHPSA